jgi:hypothetical protein
LFQLVCFWSPFLLLPWTQMEKFPAFCPTYTYGAVPPWPCICCKKHGLWNVVSALCKTIGNFYPRNKMKPSRNICEMEFFLSTSIRSYMSSKQPVLALIADEFQL